MDIETFREYCLSFPNATEKMPFEKFARGRMAILVFYVGGHMFCYFDINDFTSITVKCQPEKIAELKERFNAVGKPYNGNPKYWISIRLDDDMSDDDIRRLVRSSYTIVSKRK